MTLLKHELKLNVKLIIIWSACVGFTCFGCILLFGGLRESMEQMAEAYAQMGAFSTALGMDRLSVSTMEGFYATEIALVYALGGAMFAAMAGASMLSKEEEGRTSEFLNTLPLGREYIVFWKYLSVSVMILLFNLICTAWELAGFAAAKETPSGAGFLLFHGAQLLMHMEVGSICFFISSFCKRKQTGAALGLAVLLYVMDLVCRIVPDIEGLKYITPYYFSNATDIFTAGKIDGQTAIIGALLTLICFGLAAAVYRKRDLSA
ncbi:MAG: ABC transporter permease [Clostridium sp.]|nr:ABC transporter permease [Clostridium sp.]